MWPGSQDWVKGDKASGLSTWYEPRALICTHSNEDGICAQCPSHTCVLTVLHVCPLPPPLCISVFVSFLSTHLCLSLPMYVLSLHLSLLSICVSLSLSPPPQPVCVFLTVSHEVGCAGLFFCCILVGSQPNEVPTHTHLTEPLCAQMVAGLCFPVFRWQVTTGGGVATPTDARKPP